MKRSCAVEGKFFLVIIPQMDFYLPPSGADQAERASPEETRIVGLSAAPYPDGYRLRVNMEITPFQKRPVIEVTLFDADENETATASIVEPMSWKIEFTMHVRGELRNPYTLSARLYYPEGPEQEPVFINFSVEPPQGSAQADSND
ncbi:MAG: hypothetical protein LDL51_08475 [Chloroflexi bacterium]|nr:hypothetical protein [Chloroflexota bacterium]